MTIALDLPEVADATVKRVLMVVFHFVPLVGSSGVRRGLHFVQHLPQYGWEPLVLTSHAMAYEEVDNATLSEIPPHTVVERAIAFDAARHLSIRGRYLGALSQPDRWVTWRYDAVRRGLRMIRKYRPEIIWSTYPIATAHLIASELQRRSGLPWVADFRDPMAQDDYPEDARTWQNFKSIEKMTLERATCSVFVTPGAAAHYRRTYNDFSPRIEVIENGYDEPSFERAESISASSNHGDVGRMTLLHSGAVYPRERDPTALFEALGRLRACGWLDHTRLRIRFRAAVHESLLKELAERAGVTDAVEICPPIGYISALREMMDADALFVMQASGCNQQIPAKVYEYLRARRPILCLADAAGDTARMLRAAGVSAMARLDDAAQIASVLKGFVERLERGDEEAPDEAVVRSASRVGRAAQLASILDSIRAH